MRKILQRLEGIEHVGNIAGIRIGAIGCNTRGIPAEQLSALGHGLHLGELADELSSGSNRIIMLETLELKSVLIDGHDMGWQARLAVDGSELISFRTLRAAAETCVADLVGQVEAEIKTARDIPSAGYHLPLASGNENRRRRKWSEVFVCEINRCWRRSAR